MLNDILSLDSPPSKKELLEMSKDMLLCQQRLVFLQERFSGEQSK